MPTLERALAERVLLAMVVFAQADAPFVGGLEALPAVGAGAHVRAFDR